MAVVRKSAAEAWAAGIADRETLAATTDEQIDAQMIEDGENPADPMAGYTRLAKMKRVRERTFSPVNVAEGGSDPGKRNVRHKGPVRKKSA